MRITIALIALQTAILFLCSCNSDIQKSQGEGDCVLVKYYSTIPLRESPHPDFRGVVELSKEDALDRNHYRFEYDEMFRLKSVSFCLGSSLRAPNHTANYFFTTPVQKFEYQQGKEIRTFFDLHDNQTTQRGVYREVYTLDQLGKRVSLQFEDLEGNNIENTWGISNYTWEHQLDGSVIESRFDLKGTLKSLRPHFEFYTIRLSYGQNGILALMQNIDSENNLLENNTGVAQDKLLFDEEGRWLGWNVLDREHELHRGNGPNVAKGINTSNEYGYEVAIRYEDVDGSPIINAHGFWGSERFYDKYGNYSYRQFTDSLGNAGINERTGYCYANYMWDQYGMNKLEVRLLDKTHEPVLHTLGGYYKIQYKYDENDNLISTNFLGLDDEKIDRLDNGVSYITYKYDELYARIESKRYNKDDEAVE